MDSERKHIQEYAAELREKDNVLMNAYKKAPQLMTIEEYKFIRGLLHPDRHPVEEKAKWEKAFNIFQRLIESIDPKAKERWGW
jgi:hypothetical protein